MSAAAWDVPGWYRGVARLRGVAVPAGVVLLIAAAVVGLARPGTSVLVPGAVAVGLTVVAIGTMSMVVPYQVEMAARRVSLPVDGRSVVLNSSGTRVPSHGTHGFGQTYAIDLVYDPGDGSRPVFGTGPAFRPSTDYPAFGRPITAPCAGTVVRTYSSARDHEARATWVAVLYMLLEGAIREVFGPRAMMGNHVIVATGDGAFALLAHLQRGSVSVRAGDAVTAGQVVGRCGNSGNSSEPHVHMQLMDHANPVIAAGLPFEFADIRVDGRAHESALPTNEAVVEPR